LGLLGISASVSSSFWVFHMGFGLFLGGLFGFLCGLWGFVGLGCLMGASAVVGPCGFSWILFVG
jgi:hypothetical protein